MKPSLKAIAPVVRACEGAAVATMLLVLPLRAGASAAGVPASQTFEVAPLFGYQVGGNLTQTGTDQHLRLGDHASFALAIDARADAVSQYELFYGRQPTVLRSNGVNLFNVAVEYLHVGGTLTLDDSTRAKPYLAGGLGVSRMSPDSAPGTDDTSFSISLALGLRVPVSEHFSLRAEGRGFLSVLNGDGALFCHSGQNGAICQITAQGSTLFQFAFLAGVAYSF